MTPGAVLGRSASPTKSPPTLATGAIIDGRYEVTLSLGAGGMGEVYEVMHLGLRRPFALKCLKEAALDDARAVQRFMKEIRGLAAVDSDFVVGISDCGKLESGAPYFVMERLRGQDLRKLLVEVDSLTPTRAIKLAIDACLGLQAVHEAGLVHRDLKPENLFATCSDDGSERCKVLDFGIAKTVGTGSTKQHSLLGTLKYMAPEQMLDASSVGPATDIYGLGAILYECLTGRPPHVAETEPELMFKIMNTEPAPLTTFAPSLDTGLTSVVARTLHRDPERRHASAVALAAALASCLVTYDDDRRAEDPSPLGSPPALPAKAGGALTRICGALSIGMVLLGVALAARSHARNVPASAVATRPAVPVSCVSSAPVMDLRGVQTKPTATSSVAPTRAVPRPARKSHQPPAARNAANLPAIDERNPYE
jgi:serine/threonine protein kinase